MILAIYPNAGIEQNSNKPELTVTLSAPNAKNYQSLTNLLANNTLKGTFNYHKLEIIHNLTVELQKIHKENIVHRNLNPDSILINPETREVKIINFDCAEKSWQPTKPEFAGSMLYNFEEQLTERNTYEPHDLYALNGLMHSILDGEEKPLEYRKQSLQKIQEADLTQVDMPIISHKRGEPMVAFYEDRRVFSLLDITPPKRTSEEMLSEEDESDGERMDNGKMEEDADYKPHKKVHEPAKPQKPPIIISKESYRFHELLESLLLPRSYLRPALSKVIRGTNRVKQQYKKTMLGKIEKALDAALKKSKEQEQFNEINNIFQNITSEEEKHEFSTLKIERNNFHQKRPKHTTRSFQKALKAVKIALKKWIKANREINDGVITENQEQIKAILNTHRKQYARGDTRSAKWFEGFMSKLNKELDAEPPVYN